MGDKQKTILAERSTERLIEQLVGELTPARPAKVATSVATTTALCFLLVVTLTGALLGVVGNLRPDVLGGSFPVRIGLGVAGATLAVAAAVTAFVRLLVPGRKIHGAVVALLGVGVLLIAVSVVAAAWTPSGLAFDLAGLSATGLKCTGLEICYALLIAVPLVVAAKRSAPTHLRLTGLFIGIAGGAAGFAGLLLHCVNDQILHLGAYHFLPALALALAGCSWAAVVLRW